MAEHLTNMQDQIIDEDKGAIEALLGVPHKVSYWKNVRPQPGSDAAALALFEAEQLDEIWIYSNGRVHFNIAGKALKVDNNVAHDLPPEQDPPLIA